MLYVARDKDGSLYMYDAIPKRGENAFFAQRGYDCFHLDSSMLPDVTFDNSPQKMELHQATENKVNPNKYLCYRCKHELIIQSQWMGSEIGAAPDEPDDDFMVTLMSCPHCGLGCEIYDVPVNEQCKHPYFNQQENQ